MESTRTEKSAALLMVVTVLSPKRSGAAGPRSPIVEVHSVPAAAAEAIAPGIPAEDMVPAILRGRTPLDRILPVQVRTAAVLRTLRAEADGPPVQAPAVQVAVLAQRVQAAQAAARTVNLSEGCHFLRYRQAVNSREWAGAHQEKIIPA